MSNDETATAQASRKATLNRPHIAAAAAIDELLASEARASLRRTREALREEPPKVRTRITVPPARIVAKPLQSAAWRAPFFSLAVVVGLSTLISACSVAYLFMRPQTVRATADAELVSIRETISQLRRQVAELSLSAASNRLANNAPSTSERVATRPIERDFPVQRLNVARLSEEIATASQAVPAPEFTGSVQTSAVRSANASRNVIEGWFIRRAYDGSALLENRSGIIEVSPGQDVPAIGRIQEIKNDGGRWQVITSKGIIVGAKSSAP